MKKSLLTAALGAIVFSAMPAVAEPAPATAKPAQAKPAAPDVQEFDKRLVQAQENLKKMQEQMESIRQTQDPQLRQKLLEEHWVTMRQNMQMMHGIWGPGGGMGMGMGGMAMGPGMMRGGPMMGWGHMGGYYGKLTPEQMKQRQYMMEQYVPMQQMMMDHMMQHQQYRWGK